MPREADEEGGWSSASSKQSYYFAPFVERVRAAWNDSWKQLQEEKAKNTCLADEEAYQIASNTAKLNRALRHHPLVNPGDGLKSSREILS